MKHTLKTLTTAMTIVMLVTLITGCFSKKTDNDVSQSQAIEENRTEPAPPPPAAVIEPAPTMSAPVVTSAPAGSIDSGMAEPIIEEPAPAIVEPMMVEPSGAAAQRPSKTIGNILYNPPTEMTMNVTETVEVRIAKNEVSEDNLTGTGAIQKDEIPISQTMKVQLCCGDSQKGDPFDIHSVSAPEQLVDDPLLDDDEYTEWVFQVTPRQSGEQQLQLLVTALYNYPDGSIRQKDRVLNKAIKVQVDTTKEAQNWISQHWHWLGLLLAIPLAAILVRRRNKPDKHYAAASGNESIFISYRRDDSSGYTLAIYEKLKSALGDESVFMDMDDIPHGEDFAKHIEKVLNKADTVLVMIGNSWLNASNSQGRRLDNPEDFVRMEVATALTKDLRVIPVLLRGAEMPEPDELPDTLKALSTRNAIRIHDDQFDESIQRLIQSITR